MTTGKEERKRELNEEEKQIKARKILQRCNIENWMDLSEDDFMNVTEFICELRATIFSNGLYPRKLAIDTQKLRIKSIKTGSEEYSRKLEENSSDIEDKRAGLKEAEKELQEAEKKLQEAEKKFQRAEEKVAGIEAKISKLEDKERWMKINMAENDQLLKDSIDILQKMDDIVLFHQSATLYQIHKYQCENIYVTKNDAAVFSRIEDRTGGVFSVDEVLDADKAEQFVTKFPSDFFFRYSEEERESIVNYCNLLINLMMEEDGNRKIIPAFCNSTIAEILRLNGLENFRD